MELIPGGGGKKNTTQTNARHHQLNPNCFCLLHSFRGMQLNLAYTYLPASVATESCFQVLFVFFFFYRKEKPFLDIQLTKFNFLTYLNENRWN